MASTKEEMMKKGLLTMMCVMLFASAGYGGESGEAIFSSLGCKLCHHAEKSSQLNPSLAEIAGAYQGKEAQLIDFLKGLGSAIVKPEKSIMMKRYVEKTKALADSDRQSLVDFIMEHQKQ
jgi:cytochrome c